MRRPLLLAMCALAALVVACAEDGFGTPTSTTLPSGTLPPDTTDDTAPEVIEPFIDEAAAAGRIVTELDGLAGANMNETQLGCTIEAMQATVDSAVLVEYNRVLNIADLAPDQRAAVFAAADSCVSPADFAGNNASRMELGGVPLEVAMCVQSQLRTRLGFAGLWQLGAAASETIDDEQALNERVRAIYTECGLDQNAVTPDTSLTDPPTIPPTTLELG